LRRKDDGVQVKTLLRKLAGLGRAVVVCGWELVDGQRPGLVVRVRVKRARRGRCGRCGALAPCYDQGGGQRRWRHIDVGFGTCELIGDAPRVDCRSCGPTVAAVPWARHDSAFSRAFEDLVVYDAVATSKQKTADRHGISWRAVNNACVRLATEALGRVDLLDGLVAVAIDEVKYKKGQRYLTVVCDHFTGRVIWAAKGRSKDTVNAFFDALGDERCDRLRFVTCDGAAWIHDVVADRAPDATVCLDTFHVIGWATEALDEVRRGEWNTLRQTGGATAAKQVKGLRWLLLRNWQNLTGAQKATIRELQGANRRMFRAWQLKEELRDIFTMPLLAARRALDDWLAWASRSKLTPFVKLARTIRRYRKRDRSHHRMAPHQRPRRIQQLRHRPHPRQRPRLPRPPSVHHHDPPRPRRPHTQPPMVPAITHESVSRPSFLRAGMEPGDDPRFTRWDDGWGELLMHWQLPAGATGTYDDRLTFLEALAGSYDRSLHFFPTVRPTDCSVHPLMAWWAFLHALSMLAAISPLSGPATSTSTRAPTLSGSTAYSKPPSASFLASSPRQSATSPSLAADA
jgi:transposase